VRVYLDESGDLGWNFGSPYMKGGSSRFLTLAFLFVPDDKVHLPKRVIKHLYDKYKWNPSAERKASELNADQKAYFCARVSELARDHPDIEICSITVRKENVQPHIKTDGNKLYNYMTKLCALRRMARHSKVHFIPDERSVKVKSGNSLADYLQTELWFTEEKETLLHCEPGSSAQHRNLQFTDYVTNCIWRAYEFQDRRFLNALGTAVHCQSLFFGNKAAGA
jgi:hypothetical protein